MTGLLRQLLPRLLSRRSRRLSRPWRYQSRSVPQCRLRGRRRAGAAPQARDGDERAGGGWARSAAGGVERRAPPPASTTAVTTASTSAPPTWNDVWNRLAASPFSSSGSPAGGGTISAGDPSPEGDPP